MDDTSAVHASLVPTRSRRHSSSCGLVVSVSATPPLPAVAVPPLLPSSEVAGGTDEARSARPGKPDNGKPGREVGGAAISFPSSLKPP